jgi:DNA-binding MarR family transcriptional regulator
MVARQTERDRLLQRVGREIGRELTSANLFLHTLIAGKVGLNATDTRCLEILARSPGAPLTAGALTEATGLTTGAITGIVDRLEIAGYVKRVRDTKDRRKIFVELVPGADAKLAKLYEGIGREMERLASGYSVAELQLIHKFLETNLDILKRQIEVLSESQTA